MRRLSEIQVMYRTEEHDRDVWDVAVAANAMISEFRPVKYHSPGPSCWGLYSYRKGFFDECSRPKFPRQEGTIMEEDTNDGISQLPHWFPKSQRDIQKRLAKSQEQVAHQQRVLAEVRQQLLVSGTSPESVGSPQDSACPKL